MGSFRDFLNKRSTLEVDRAPSKSVKILEDEEEMDYRPAKEVVVEASSEIIPINKHGADLLMHNMACAGIAAAARQTFIFFKRLIQP
jgi:hypothetical protein